jgi:hypothetical protein
LSGGNKKRVIAPLKTIGDVAHQLGRVYRQMLSGEIDNDTGRARAYVLTSLRQALEVGEIERRVNELKAEGTSHA